MTRPTAELIYPAGLGLAGALAAFLAGGLNWYAASLACMLALAGAATGVHLAAKQAANLASIETYLEGQLEFSAQVVPVWKAHLEFSRQHMETAVNALAERFDGIVDRLDAALRTAASASDPAEDHGNGLEEVFSRGEQGLLGVLARQQEATNRMRVLLVNVEALDQFVVAGTLHTAIVDTCKRVRESVALADDSTAAARCTIDAVLADFKGLIDTFQRSRAILKEESLGIQSEVNQALVQLQFQDRVSQIMSRVNKNMDGLPSVLREQLQHYARTRALQAPDSEELLAELVKNYVMSNQHGVHQGDRSKLKNSTDISFF